MEPGKLGLASHGKGPLQFQQDSVTGTVTHLALQDILEQFQEQLGIVYSAPKEALGRPVSVELHEESLEQALAKILAQWDYALKRGPAGTIQHIFVVRKISAGDSEGNMHQANESRVDSSNLSEMENSFQPIMGEPSVALGEDNQVEAPSFGTVPRVRQPVSHQLDEAELREALEEAEMGRIPPAGYPEMPVTQISEEEQQAILRSLNPSTTGTGEWTKYQEMNITPVSEEQAQEILRSFTHTGARSGKGSLP